MIKNIVFDWNGTLLNDAYLCYIIEKEMFKEINLSLGSFETYRNTFTHPVSKYYEILGIKNENELYKKLNKIFFDNYLSRYQKEAKLFDGVKETLMYLKNRGYNLYIISATEINTLKNQLEYYDIIKFFDDYIASNNIAGEDKISYGKTFASSHNFNKDNTLLIGDTAHDKELADALNINYILFDQGHYSKERLEIYNRPVLSNYYEIRNYIEDNK